MYFSFFEKIIQKTTIKNTFFIKIKLFNNLSYLCNNYDTTNDLSGEFDTKIGAPPGLLSIIFSY